MLAIILYGLLLIIELIFAILLCAFALSMVLSSVMGAPYVPTKSKEVYEFLKHVKPKKKSLFIELGCGDGRVVRNASKMLGVHAVGVDINPVLIYWAKVLTFFENVKNVEFKIQNIFKTDLSKADVIYVFLMPEMLVKLKDKLKKEMKKDAVLISHGFRIEGWDRQISKTLDRKPFPTYFYTFSKEGKSKLTK